MEEKLLADREKIIDRIYDLLLDPQNTNEFFSLWEKYISEVTVPFKDLSNAQLDDEQIISDGGLEAHFARVHAILENQRRDRNAQGGDKNANANTLLRFDLDGAVIHSADEEDTLFNGISRAADMARCLTREARPLWAEFLATSKRAPSVNRMHLYPMKTGGNLLALNARNDLSGVVEIMVVRLSVSWSAQLRNLLSAHFDLTNSELQLAEALTIHGSLDRVAQSERKSKNTLRSQLRSIFAKLNVNSQAAVVQTIAILAQICERTAFEETPNESNILLGEQTTLDVDGEPVPVHFHGPEDGHPIVFIHGMLDGVALNKRMENALFKHNLRLICPIRPNYGVAKSSADITQTHDLYAHQLNGIAQQLNLEKVILLGHMSGGVFGFAAAPVLGDRVAGLVNISCGAPILSINQLKNLSHRQKAFAYTARYAPKMLPALMRIGMAQIDTANITSLMTDMYPKNSPDRPLLANSDIAPIILDGYRFAVAQGYQGFHGDALLVTGDWSELVEKNDKPVLLIHGKYDPAVCFRAVCAFAEREEFEIRKYESDGQLLLYGKPNEILGDVRSFIDRMSE